MLARQKVAEESNLAKLNVGAQNEKNQNMRKRILQQVTDSQNKIAKMDQLIADLDRALHQLAGN